MHDDSCTMVGDAQRIPEPGIRPEQIPAIVTAVFRKGKLLRKRASRGRFLRKCGFICFPSARWSEVCTIDLKIMIKGNCMRVSDQFILRTIADEHLLIPTGQIAFRIKGLIALSESGALLYNRLKDGCSREDLVAALTKEYEVSEDEAGRDTDAFLDQMRGLDMLLED